MSSVVKTFDPSNSFLPISFIQNMIYISVNGSVPEISIIDETIVLEPQRRDRSSLRSGRERSKESDRERSRGRDRRADR